MSPPPARRTCADASNARAAALQVILRYKAHAAAIGIHSAPQGLDFWCVGGPYARAHSRAARVCACLFAPRVAIVCL